MTTQALPGVVTGSPQNVDFSECPRAALSPNDAPSLAGFHMFAVIIGTAPWGATSGHDLGPPLLRPQVLKGVWEAAIFLGSGKSCCLGRGPGVVGRRKRVPWQTWR